MASKLDELVAPFLDEDLTVYRDDPTRIDDNGSFVLVDCTAEVQALVAEAQRLEERVRELEAEPDWSTEYICLRCGVGGR